MVWKCVCVCDIYWLDIKHGHYSQQTAYIIVLYILTLFLVYPTPRKKTKHNRNQTADSEGRKISIIRKLTEMGYDESMVERGYETISKSKSKYS